MRAYDKGFDDGYELAKGVTKDDVSDAIEWHEKNSSTIDELIRELKDYFKIDDDYLKERKRIREEMAVFL